MSAAPPPTAAERLAASRERLRQALHADAAGAASAGDSDSPAAALLLDAVGSAWAKHPLALAVDLGGQALRPLAQRHPWWLVGGAALLGAAVVRHPRALLRPSLLGGMLPQALKAFVLQAAAMPADATDPPR